MIPKLSIIKGENRKDNIKQSLELIFPDIKKTIKNKKSDILFIKINAIDFKYPLACTHIGALDSVLEFFYDKFNDKFKKIIVGDNTFVFTKYKGGPYRTLLKKYPKIKLSDLTEFESENIHFKGIKNKKIGKVSLLPKKAFTISLALPKTHDDFVYTGCLKNMFGCVLENRASLHAMKIYERAIINKYVKGNKLKWENLVNVIEKTKPDLCILDAYEGMEGNGPILGTKVSLKIAMSSLDGIALDRLTSKICGLNNVPYLILLPYHLKKVEVIKKGFKNLDEISKKFKPHYNIKYQKMSSYNSKIPKVDIRYILTNIKRVYRIKDKIMDKIKLREKNNHI